MKRLETRSVTGWCAEIACGIMTRPGSLKNYFFKIVPLLGSRFQCRPHRILCNTKKQKINKKIKKHDAHVKSLSVSVDLSDGFMHEVHCSVTQCGFSQPVKSEEVLDCHYFRRRPMFDAGCETSGSYQRNCLGVCFRLRVCEIFRQD